MDRPQLPAPMQGWNPSGTKDGDGAGDHDEPYRFGRRPRASAPWPFTERQYGRLLVLRGRMADDDAYPDDRGNEHPIAFMPDGVWVANPEDLLGMRRAA